MTNKEHYAKEILDIACTGSSIAVTKTGKLLACDKCHCCDCAFYSGTTCGNMCKEWCNSEYKEPEIDWSKVPVDTPIYNDNEPRHFAGYNNNSDIVYFYSFGKTSFTNKSTLASIHSWHVKLAREEDIEKYIKESEEY